MICICVKALQNRNENYERYKLLFNEIIFLLKQKKYLEPLSRIV